MTNLSLANLQKPIPIKVKDQSKKLPSAYNKSDLNSIYQKSLDNTLIKSMNNISEEQLQDL